MFKKIIVILLSCYLVSLAGVVYAEEIKPTGPAISPAVINLSLKPGETTKSSFEYFNNSEESQNLTVGCKAIIMSEGDHSTPSFTGKDGNPATSPMTGWVKFTKSSYVVEAGDKVKINFSVTTPKTAEAGKYFVYVFASQKAEDEKGSSINIEIGPKVIAQISQAYEQPVSPIKNILGQGNIALYASGGLALLALILLLSLLFRRSNKKSRSFAFEEPKKIAKKEKKTKKLKK